MNALSDRLEKTISELKTANNELQLDLQRRSEQEQMRQEFLANVSHELKTPIALIMQKDCRKILMMMQKAVNFTVKSLWTRLTR
jgi:signal transduction histidine kinase